MSQTDGEKEIVLGNKQLISLFFVVVALCGVFFAMGYMIGHNSSKAVVANLDGTASPAAASPASQPQTSDSDSTQAAAPQPQTSDAASLAPAATGSDTPATETHPAQDSAPASEPSAPAPAEAKQPPAKTGRDVPIVPERGATYLQVTALRRGDADNLVKTLREQKFPALLANSSKPELFRVLVGPYRQTVDVADAKARLKALGFANAFVYK